MPAAIKVCAAGQKWSWPIKLSQGATETVYFHMLAPRKQSSDYQRAKGNNYSCVLQISWRDKQILLPGDIERQVEANLLTEHRLPEVDILLAPHHGSKTSSTAAFVTAIKPAHVVFSAGYRHQFGHPHQDVQRRYAEAGS
jgi:competence protein ComEC